MFSDLRYQENSVVSEDSTNSHSKFIDIIRVPKLAAIPKLIPPVPKPNSSSPVPSLHLQRLPRIPLLKTKLIHLKQKGRSERSGVCMNDDLFFLNEYRKKEIRRTKGNPHPGYPFWFQDISVSDDLSLRKQRPVTIFEYKNLNETDIPGFSVSDYNEWFRGMSRELKT